MEKNHVTPEIVQEEGVPRAVTSSRPRKTPGSVGASWVARRELARTGRMLSDLTRSDDERKGIRAFTEKRSAKFRRR